MAEERFPYETCSWPGDTPEISERWLAALERNGVENVRARLAQNDAGSRGSMAIGTEAGITKGFAQEWIAWHDRRKSERETARHNRQIFWTRIAAIAASIAGASAAIGWAWTIFHKT
jgi:hypothetical protein